MMPYTPELHNKLAGPIVASIVKPVLEAGGDNRDVIVLTESVVMGVCLLIVIEDGDDRVVDTICDGVKRRLAASRLERSEPAGHG